MVSVRRWTCRSMVQVGRGSRLRGHLFLSARHGVGEGYALRSAESGRGGGGRVGSAAQVKGQGKFTLGWSES